MKANHIGWTGDIGCEGGPVLVANAADFDTWRGAETLDAAHATELHYWSSFTGELPPQWHVSGTTGHQYLPAADPCAAREALMSTVLAQWPGTDIDRSWSTWRATRPDGRVLHAALRPDSEYDRVIRELGEEGVHAFGDGASGYFWSVEPGMVRIAVDATRKHLLLSQVACADDEEGVREAHAHALNAPWQDGPSHLRYRVTAGPVVVAWSPNSARDAQAPLVYPAQAGARPGVLLDMATGSSAALLWLEPGVYASTCQYHEEERWAVSWCRLQRVG